MLSRQLEFLHPAHAAALFPPPEQPRSWLLVRWTGTFSSPAPGRVRRRPQVGPVALGQLQRQVHRHQAETTVPQAVVLGILDYKRDACYDLTTEFQHGYYLPLEIVKFGNLSSSICIQSSQQVTDG